MLSQWSTWQTKGYQGIQFLSGSWNVQKHRHMVNTCRKVQSSEHKWSSLMCCRSLRFRVIFDGPMKESRDAVSASGFLPAFVVVIQSSVKAFQDVHNVPSPWSDLSSGGWDGDLRWRFFTAAWSGLRPSFGGQTLVGHEAVACNDWWNNLWIAGYFGVTQNMYKCILWEVVQNRLSQSNTTCSKSLIASFFSHNYVINHFIELITP